MAFAFPCRHLLVPMDFSDHSQRSLAYAVAIARAAGARMTLLTVIEDRFPYPELFAWDKPGEDFYKSLRTRALARMEEVLAAQGAGDVAVERVVIAGNPRREIVEMVEEVGADLIVMARHGSSSGLRSAVMGSTTETVLRSAPCPVLVLPAEPEAGAGVPNP